MAKGDEEFKQYRIRVALLIKDLTDVLRYEWWNTSEEYPVLKEEFLERAKPFLEALNEQEETE